MTEIKQKHTTFDDHWNISWPTDEVDLMMMILTPCVGNPQGSTLPKDLSIGRQSLI
jgi:hypothetical protein